MADFLDDILKKLAPLHLRTFGKTLIGDRSDITEQNLSDDELQRLATHVLNQGQSMPASKHTKRMMTSYNSNQPDLSSTFGTFSTIPAKDGGIDVEDRYDFWPKNKPTPYKHRMPERLGAIANLLGLALAGKSDPGDELPNIALNGAARKVRVHLDPKLLAAAKARMKRTILDEDN